MIPQHLESDMSKDKGAEKLTFKRNGAVMRGTMRVAQLTRRQEKGRYPEWGLKFLPESGINPPLRWFGLLSLAKSSVRYQLDGDL